jgi:rubrerythrin
MYSVRNNASVKVLEKILECSIWLEEKTAELYYKIADRVGQRNIGQILRIIARQSESHAEMLNWILENILEKRKPTKINCVKIVGEVGKTTVDLIKDVENRETITNNDLCNLIGDLEFVENGIGEETYSRILLPLIKTTLKQTYQETITLEIAEEIIGTIVNEEKLHERLVTLISELTGCDVLANPSSGKSYRHQQALLSTYPGTGHNTRKAMDKSTP